MNWRKLAIRVRRVEFRLSAPLARFARYCELKHNPYYPSPTKEHRDWIDGKLSDDQARECYAKYDTIEKLNAAYPR